MSNLFQVGEIVTRLGDDLHRILQISSYGDSMLVECIRPDKGVVVDDDGTLSEPCYKIGDQEWNLPRRYSYPEFMTIEGEAAHRQAHGITDAGKCWPMKYFMKAAGIAAPIAATQSLYPWIRYCN